VTRSRRSSTATTVYISIVAVLIALPILYAVVGAFRPSSALNAGVGGLVPDSFTLDNFGRALDRAPLIRQMGNSLIVTAIQTFLQVGTAVLAAYAITFGRLRFPRAVFAFFLITMMIPGETTIIANYMTIQSMGLYDTIAAVFLPYGAAAYAVFLLRQAFISFPQELHEAAQLDGVGPLRFLVRFLVPLSLPTIMAAGLTSAIAAWNGYMWPLLITDSPSNRTVQAGVAQLDDSVGPDIGAVLAGTTLVSLPTIVLVLISQRALTTGLTQGALK
jgi:sn-glycerol 3-phosphate transport system permease protein